MKFYHSIFLLVIPLFLINCRNHVKKDDRIEQIYPFASSRYFEYKKNDNSSDTDAFGKLKFSKSTIIVIVNNNIETFTDKCNIKTVTYDDNPNELEYQTDNGNFVVKFENDTIKEVTLYTRDFLTIFYKTKLK